MKTCRLAVLVSGNGSNLQAILDACGDACEKKTFPAEVVLVVSNKADAFALKRAQKSGVPTAVIAHGDFPNREAFEDEMIALIDRAKADLVILAGFMRVLSAHFVRPYADRILNIHPGRLPSFPGTDAIGQAWRYGVRVTRVTVHLVDEGTDTGPVILQEAVPIDPKDSLETLEKKIHAVEHRLFPEAIRLFAEGRIKIDGRKVTVQGETV